MMGAMVNRPSPQEIFSQLDTDGSEGLSADELEDTELGNIIGDDFATIDTSGDGELSDEEISTHLGAANEAGAPPPPPPGPPPSSSDSDLNQSIVSALLAIAESLSETDTDSDDDTTISSLEDSTDGTDSTDLTDILLELEETTES